MRSIVVIYHGNCSDGFGGAWSAYKKFGNKAEYIGANHSDPPLDYFKNKQIYFIDFSYKPIIIKKLIKNNESVVIIDHHITAEKSVKLAHDYSYNNSHSGSVLAWRYFHPKKSVPKLLKYIEDFDLWKFRLPYTKEIMTYLGSATFNFRSWNGLVKDFERVGTRKKYIDRGRIAWNYEKKLMLEIVKENAYLVKFENYKIFAVNANHHFASYLGNLLVKKRPSLAIVWNQKGNEIGVSLRSDGKVDVSKIAEKYGGGGHRAAAGFGFSVNKKTPWKVIKPTK